MIEEQKNALCTELLIKEFLILAKPWQQPQYPSVGDNYMNSGADTEWSNIQAQKGMLIASIIEVE